LQAKEVLQFQFSKVEAFEQTKWLPSDSKAESDDAIILSIKSETNGFSFTVRNIVFVYKILSVFPLVRVCNDLFIFRPVPDRIFECLIEVAAPVSENEGTPIMQYDLRFLN
jgi:hypothetical protein